VIIDGFEVEPIIEDALARAGYGPWAVAPVMTQMILHLMTMENLTPTRVAAIADEVIPRVIEEATQERLADWSALTAYMPSTAVH
jgi:hypothetical protein